MDLYGQLLTRTDVYLLASIRLGGIFVTSPVFGSRYVPTQWKAAFSMLVALVVLPLVPAPPGGPPATLWAWGAMAVKELAVGLILGYVANLVFVAVQVGGELLDIEVGFGIVNIIDPQSGQPIPLIGNFQQLLAFLIFLIINGHHLLIATLVQSFQAIPLGLAVAGPGVEAALISFFAAMFLAGVKLAAPVIGALFLANVALVMTTN
ncbi:MAG: flagellar biosynthetic protein FliR, partial [Firmicutes bacterium]|nr:flagellar biosynthetic protein FliR [Bacillota bacterium]